MSIISRSTFICRACSSLAPQQYATVNLPHVCSRRMRTRRPFTRTMLFLPFAPRSYWRISSCSTCWAVKEDGQSARCGKGGEHCTAHLLEACRNHAEMRGMKPAAHAD